MRRRELGRFWSWFAAAAPLPGQPLDDPTFIAGLNRRVAALGPFAWEVGPGLQAPNALTISPGGDRTRLEQTRTIIAQAPEIAGWEFHHAKPAKKWAYRFNMSWRGRPIIVDASAWTFVLLRYPDGAVEVFLVAPDLESSLPTEARQDAAEILLDGVLGEERRIESVDLVSVASVMDASVAAKPRPIAELGDAFAG